MRQRRMLQRVTATRALPRDRTSVLGYENTLYAQCSTILRAVRRPIASAPPVVAFPR